MFNHTSAELSCFEFLFVFLFFDSNKSVILLNYLSEKQGGKEKTRITIDNDLSDIKEGKSMHDRSLFGERERKKKETR